MSYVFTGLWTGLHQVHTLGVDLDQGQDVLVPDRLVQKLQACHGVRTQALSEMLLRVLGRDEVLPHLPEEPHAQR